MLEELRNDCSKYLYYFLIFIILFGTFVRFYGIGNAWLESDEPSVITSGIKLTHDNPYDARIYGYEHPAFARWVMGLPTKWIDADYSATLSVPPNMYVFRYYAPSKETYVSFRMVSAVFGALSVLLIFLISKKLFGLKAGLWSTVLSAISFDFIFWNRIAFQDSTFIGLLLLTVYFYLRYLEKKGSSKRLLFMAATAIFFTLSLGSRAFTPMFLIPVLFISQFMLNKGKPKENILFSFLLLLGIYVFMTLIWPPQIRAMAQNQWQANALSNILNFSLFDVLSINFFRNSYIYVFGLLLLVYESVILLKNKSIVERLKTPANSLVVTLLALVSFIAFSFTKYTDPRYQLILFAPLMILSGYALEKAARNKTILSFLVFLILLNAYFLVRTYPYYSEYQNFSLDKCGKHTLSCRTNNWYNHIYEQQQAASYLSNFGNPPVMTNEPNILTFYRGKATPLIGPDSRCNQKDTEQLTKTYKYIIYYGAYGGQNDLRTDTYVCPYLKNISMEIIRSFGNYTIQGMEPESLKVKIYKIII